MAYFIWDAEEQSLSFKEHFFSSAIKIFDMQNLSDTMDKWLNSRLNLEEENALEKFLKVPGQYLEQMLLSTFCKGERVQILK